MDALMRAKAIALCNAATPGPWETDTVKTDGTYGIGDDTHEGFNEFVIVDTGGRQICSTENRDLGLSEVHDEWDEDSHTAWDEPARRDAEFIAFSRTAIPAYEARVVELEAALAAAIASQRPWSDKFAGEVIDKQVEIIKGLELRAATSEARATALRPFGTLADSISPSSRNEAMLVLTTTDGGIIDTSRRVSVGHLRAARAAINAGASNDRK